MDFIETKVVSKRRLTPSSVEICLDAHHLDFSECLAGQYITIECVIDGEAIQRCYSLSSARATDNHLSIGVKKIRRGKMSTYIVDTLSVDDPVRIMPARGHFLINDDQEHYVLFAGGSGITPIYSIIKTLTTKGKSATLYYANKTPEEVMYKAELEKLAHTYDLTIKYVYSKQGQRIDFDRVYDIATEHKSKPNTQYFICGPEGMMDNVKASLEYAGIDEDNITLEYFNMASSIKDNILQNKDQYQVSIIKNKETIPIEVKAGVSVLDAMLEHQIGISHSCKSGVCGSCTAKITDGAYVSTESDGLPRKKKNEGYCLTCITYPMDDKLTMEI